MNRNRADKGARGRVSAVNAAHAAPRPLLLATRSAGKLRELGPMLRDAGFAPVTLDALGIALLAEEESVEAFDTFVENSLAKARYYYERARALGAAAPSLVLADDSGLEVAALGGDPGIYSARWAGPTKDFALAMQLVHDRLQEKGVWTTPGPRANFTAALFLAWPDGSTQVFEGRVFGHLVGPPRGDQGFGYDPMFLADDASETFGEMDPEAKHAISHRAIAFQQFVEACLG